VTESFIVPFQYIPYVTLARKKNY